MPWHGVRVLLRAFADIRQAEPESGLLLIGNHLPHRVELTELMRELGIEGWVEFTGPVPPERIPGLLASCRVLVAPFAPELDRDRRDQYERYGFWWSPLKIFEYMAAGRPLVATGLGMIPDYVGDAGLIYGPGNLEELTRHVLALLRDGDLARTMGERGRRRIAETYNWQAVARATAGVYRQVTGGDPDSSAGSPGSGSTGIIPGIHSPDGRGRSRRYLPGTEGGTSGDAKRYPVPTGPDND